MPAWEPSTDPEEQERRRVIDEMFLQNLEALRAWLKRPRDRGLYARYKRAFMKPDWEQDPF